MIERRTNDFLLDSSRFWKMATANDYAKHYKTVRQAKTDEQYKLILFPDDNTISVVKAKFVLSSDRPNFVVVQAGKKKYSGVILHEGM